jgi:hypothetical protein
VGIAAASLTRGQINAVRSSTPALRHRELLGSLAYRNRMVGTHYHPTNLSDDGGSPPPPYPEPVLSTGLLSFPHFKGGFDDQKVFMFVVLRMSLDRCPGPGETTTACWANYIFG